MVISLVATKLYIPPSRTNIVLRPRLIVRLNEGGQRKLTLIAAPAGFGKTTLVTAWLADYPRPAAWLSLDEGESDPTRFLTYLVAALQTIAPTIGAGVLDVLQSAHPPPPEAILTAVLNDIVALPDAFVLVLDDYHRIDSQPVDHILAFLLDHLPPQMHLIITTREDPQFPLARLRVCDQMVALRAADLRFTPAEAAVFLTETMGLSLSASDIAALESRTEGWIAGLQLAALSMRGRDDIGQFVRSFAGDNRYIVDYLAEEVLQRQPELVRSFLLQTSILERLSGSLCDAVTGQERGQAHLEALERGNFFVVPLDDQRHWYRYHHLFADVLATHLRAEQPDQVATLHRRASAWYAQQGSAADAIRHALAAEDFARAADLVELAATAMSRLRQGAALLGWLRALPNAVVRVRPVLSVTYAHLLLDGGEVDSVEAHLRDAECWLETTAASRAQPDAPAAAMRVMDEATFRRLPGAIAVARAGQALAQGDVASTVTYARQVLDLVPEDDHLSRGGAAGFLGLAAWTGGDLAAAHQMYAAGMASLHKAGNIADTINGASTLADIRLAQGLLREARRTYEQALQRALAQGAPVVRGTADIYIGMSEIHRERNDLPAATQCLLRSTELGAHTGFPQHRYRWCVAMARLREAQGDLDGALDLLHEAERRYVSPFFPNVRPVAAVKARVWVAQGRVEDAVGWVRDQALSVADELSYVHEFAHITQARILLACATRDHDDRSLREAAGFLERLLLAAEAGKRMGSMIEILIVQARVFQAQSDLPAALVPLRQALTLAAPEGYVRMFVDEGAPMAVLLQAALADGILPSYVEKLLLAFPDDHTRKAGHDHPIAVLPARQVPQALVEPLSPRERDVLRLLRTDLSGPEIAGELMVSLHTVRTHTKNIYAKLGIGTRRAAVRRAEELGLV
jgi:LuxR family maltose regulon positive regulatory protein